MNVSHIHNCFGCGVCALACGKRIIDISLNEDGFYEPCISEPAKCTDCGFCLDVCSYSNNDIALKDISLSSYAAWSKEPSVRRNCSSGGVGFEVGRSLIDEGYLVCGVRYNVEKNLAEHYIASTVEELIPSIGSKYIQSYTIDGLAKIDRKKKYLVTGTPCQIDSFRRYIQKFHCEDNFVLMDFFCHGIPSMLMWNKYVAWAEKQVGRLTYVSWRNKQTGWHDSYVMAIDGEINQDPTDSYESYNMLIRWEKCRLKSRLSQGDMFYRLFLGDACLGNACYDRCRFKWNRSSADIRIGDAWGNRFKENEEGISAAIAFTSKGDDVLANCRCELVEYSFETIAENQMKSCPIKGNLNKKIMRSLHDETSTIVDVYDVYLRYKKYQRIVNKLKTSMRIIKKLKKKIF